MTVLWKEEKSLEKANSGTRTNLSASWISVVFEKIKKINKASIYEC